MTPEQHTEAEYDPLHEDMIRNRRRIAPGHWSNKDIDCLLRRLDEARAERDAAAAEARRQTIEECARIASKAAADYRTLRDSPNLPDSRWRWAGAVEGVEAVEREIRALLPPAPEERG